MKTNINSNNNYEKFGFNFENETLIFLLESIMIDRLTVVGWMIVLNKA